MIDDASYQVQPTSELQRISDKVRTELGLEKKPSAITKLTKMSAILLMALVSRAIRRKTTIFMTTREMMIIDDAYLCDTDRLSLW